MAALVGLQEQFVGSPVRLSTCHNARMQIRCLTRVKLSGCPVDRNEPSCYCSLIPGLPEDVAMLCLALVPRSYFPTMGAVCKRWRSFIQTKEFITVRKEVGRLEEWIYVLTSDTEGKGCHWELLGCGNNRSVALPPMPGQAKARFGVVVLDGKLLIMAGHSTEHGEDCVSDEVYQYDSRLNRWSVLAKMNVARYDFACSVINGIVYAVGGMGPRGNSLSSTEVYDPASNKWTLIESLRKPRWGCFGCSFEGKLYVMGGRSAFTIGNSRSVDIYDPEGHAWREIKNGCVMVTAHAMLGPRLFCMEWKNQRCLVTFNPSDSSWQKVPVPLTGSSAINFCFGVLGGKLLLFSLEEDPGYQTLQYDPEAPAGSQWSASLLSPSGPCLCSVTISA